MTDNSTLIAISAFSGLAGALLTQVITFANGYFTDKRKEAVEVRNQYRNKKIEIGENFFYVTGGKMAWIKQNIRYWKDWKNSRSEASLNSLNKETSRFNQYMEKLDADNWKFNLINLYFEVSFTNDDVIQSNAKSHDLYMRYLDLSEKIANSEGDEKEEAYKQYAMVIFEMCSHYEELYKRLEHDMEIVKRQLLNDFAVTI